MHREYSGFAAGLCRKNEGLHQVPPGQADEDANSTTLVDADLGFLASTGWKREVELTRTGPAARIACTFPSRDSLKQPVVARVAFRDQVDKAETAGNVSVLLSVLSYALLAANWFIFACGLALLTMIALRTRIEEAKLLERFGVEYRRYKERTGAFFPRL
jgi:hypothetical protein